MNDPMSCIERFCSECRDRDAWAIGNCPKTECALHPVRPNQVLFGQPRSDWSDEECAEQVLLNLDSRGLKTLRIERALAILKGTPHVR